MPFFNINDGPDPKVGYDVDKNTFEKNGVTYGDYDVLVNAKVGGGGSYIMDPDKGPEMIYNDSIVGGERVYNLEAMLMENQDPSLRDMIDLTNNGRVGNAETMVSDKEVVPDAPTLVAPVLDYDDQETSIKGIIEKNAVNDILFSAMNMKVLQDGIRYGVNQRTGRIIGEQSPNELYIIMRSIMLQYANFQTSGPAVIEEVRRLNVKILLYCIENVTSNVLQQIQYIKDIDTLPIPIDRPTYVDKPNNYTYDISNLL